MPTAGEIFGSGEPASCGSHCGIGLKPKYLLFWDLCL